MAKVTVYNFFHFFDIAALMIFLSSASSLFISWWIYDRSGLYRLDWITGVNRLEKYRIANMTAGFDEFSELLVRHFPNSELKVYDFFNALRRKEISIKRARHSSPDIVPRMDIGVDYLVDEGDKFDFVFLLLAAHEIREEDSRIAFLKQIGRCMEKDAKIIVIEHLRDLPNFLAFNIGFLHFFSRRSWLKCFAEAGFMVTQDKSITSFLNLFILQKNGIST